MGACAEYFLKYLAQNEPQLYNTVKYECVEISERFAKHLKNFLIPRHGTRVVVHHKDCLLWNQLYEDECFIIALEVKKKNSFLFLENVQMKLISLVNEMQLLDNLSHDLVIVKNGTLFETHIIEENTHPLHSKKRNSRKRGKTFKEVLTEKTKFSFNKIDSLKLSFQLQVLFPLKDASILRYINITNCIEKWHNVVYIPTSSLHLMDVISRYFPRAHVIFEDFEFFPDFPEENEEGIKLPTMNLPRIHQSHIEYSHYLDAPKYRVDIYFPTNFQHLKKLYETVCKRNATVVRNSEFMRTYADRSFLMACERSGYNPLLQDYDNTCFLLS
jgi:hypothetical protein